jgi:hypothetical protein
MKIVNVRGMKSNDPSVVYCGRACAGWKQSPLHNPFRVGKDGTLKEVIHKFAKYLYGKVVAGDPEIGAALGALTGDSVLGCWCSPQVCHCDVVAAVWCLGRGLPERVTPPEAIRYLVITALEDRSEAGRELRAKFTSATRRLLLTTDMAAEDIDKIAPSQVPEE